ncbi:MAG: hypothetical protein M1836_002186 [Candelina mexicana]|nr:MAG: hypothetical protein M1836_002186 [Candelina mexicana]
MEPPRESSIGGHSVIEQSSKTPNADAPSPERVLRHSSSCTPEVSGKSIKDAPEWLRRCSTFDLASHPGTPPTPTPSELISGPLNNLSTASLRNAHRSRKSANHPSNAVTSKLPFASPTTVNEPLEVLSPRAKNPGQCRIPGGNLLKRLQDAAEAAEIEFLHTSERELRESGKGKGKGRDKGRKGQTDEQKEALERSVREYYENLRRCKPGEIPPSPMSYWSDDSSETEEGEMEEDEMEEDEMEEGEMEEGEMEEGEMEEGEMEEVGTEEDEMNEEGPPTQNKSE